MSSGFDASLGDKDRRRIGLPAMLAVAVAGAVLAGAAAFVALAGDMPHKVGLAERYAAIVATPMAVGLYAWREGTHARFGRLLVLAGAAWCPVALSASGNEVLFSVGRVSGWVAEVGLVCLILAFPSGRLTTRVDRWLAAAAVAVIVTLFLPTALVTETYPAPSQFSTCDADCPKNAFMLPASEPAWVDDLVVPLRELLASLIILAVVARLADRIRRATRLMRRTLIPVLLFAMLHVLSVAAAIDLRRGGADDSAINAAIWVALFGLPALCIAFLIGLVRWRLTAADSLVALAHGLLGRRGPAKRRDLIAATLSDPTVELAFRRGDGGGRWVDADGNAVSLPPPPSDRLATLILHDDEPVAAVVHDAALGDQRAFVEAVGAYAFIWDDNRHLAARVETSLTELRESRARILAAADDERRRIERDLHDGGQQRLVALRIRLELAQETMGDDPGRARSMLHRLGDEVDLALDELRSLAAGVYPSLLAARGLPDAIRTAALEFPMPARVEVAGSERYSNEVETATYFCCIEALQNVAKHAPDANSVSILLNRNGGLRFEVRDDGPGFDVEDVAAGNGLMNMRDRIGAVGGELEIRSTPGAGTVVAGTIPVPGA
jgi:signal transduction histidine kinase